MATNPIQEALAKIREEAESQDGEVEELALDSIHFQRFTPELKAAIEKHNELLFLSLNDCAMNSLDNFPKLPKLIRLELTDNKISGKSLANLVHLTELQSLSLGGNPISNFEDLQVLKGLNKLIQLDLFGCPVSDDSKYREKIFGSFASLQILDNKDKDGEEVEYDDDEDDEEDGGGEDEDDEDGDGEGEYGEDEEDEAEYDDDEEDDEDDDELEDRATSKKKSRKE